MKIRAFAAALLLAIMPRAWAVDCKPLSYFTGVPMTVAGGLVLLPVTLNGTPEIAMFDSGGVSNNIEVAKAKALGLPLRSGSFGLLNVGGGSAYGFVTADKLSIGKLDIPSMQLQLSPHNIDGVAVELSNSFFYMFDVDMDFGAGRMNFFLPDHCPGNVIYWPSDGVAEIPITVEDTKMKIPVKVDGNTMMAVIDTGTTHTTMSFAVAQRHLGLSAKDDEKVPHANDDPTLPLYEHRFSSLDMGGVVVHNPKILLMPDRVNSRQREVIPGSHIQSRTLVLPDLIIGLDVLTKLHMFVSYKERMLYIDAANDKAGKLLPPPDGEPIKLP